MLKIITALIAIVFSVEVMATVNCNAYLPWECQEVVDSDTWFKEESLSGDSGGQQIFLHIEVGCTIDVESELVDTLKVGDVFYKYKQYNFKAAVNNRFDSYTLNFLKNNKPDEQDKLPYLVCN